MMTGWSQVSISRRGAFLGFGLFMMAMGALYGLIWSPLIDDSDRLRDEIQQHEQEARAIQFKLQALQNVDQQLLRVRDEFQLRFQKIPGDLAPQHFRKEVVELSKTLDLTMRSWKPDARVPWDQQVSPFFDIGIKIEGGFYQGVVFLAELEALPWVQSISSVHIIRMTRLNGQVSTVMEVTIRVMSAATLEKVKKLLEI